MKTFLGNLLRRPVAVTAFCVFLVALAAMSLVRLPVALLPSLTYPSLLVWTGWLEVPSVQVERGLTIPIEQALANTPGVLSVSGRSQPGGSLVRLDFSWNANLDLLALDVRNKLDRLAGHLPKRAERPLVLRLDPSARPVLTIALGLPGSTEPNEEELAKLKNLAQDVVARRLEQLEGIARVRVSGGHEREIRVDLKPERMEAHGVGVLQIEQALREANVSLAGGTIKKGPFRYSLEVSGEFRGVEEVAAAVVSGSGEPIVNLGDVAVVEERSRRRRGLVRFDGREVLLLLVERRTDANTVRVASEARRSLSALREELPGVTLDVVADESTFIEAAIGGVLQALVGGSLLAVSVLFLFLRRLRLLVAVSVAVPLSLALALVLFDLLGISLNLIALSGLALGVGLLVDNSIVVVENIARMREIGQSPLDAAVMGATEVAGAITASTLTTLAVFLPLTLVSGLTGRLFVDQSLAVACSVGASLFMALTIVPLIASRDRSNVTFQDSGSPSPGRNAYVRLLDRCLAHPRWVLAASFVFLLVTAWIAFYLPRELVPETEAERLQVGLAMPTDVGLSLLEEKAEGVEAALRDSAGVVHVLADLGERDDARLDLDPRPYFEGELTAVLNSPDWRVIAQKLEDLSRKGDFALTARPVRNQLESLLVASGSDLIVDLIASDRQQAEVALPTLMKELAKQPELANVTRADPEGMTAFDLRFDRGAMLRLGAEMESLGGYLEAAGHGRVATNLHGVRDDVPIVLRTKAESIDELMNSRIPTAAGLMPMRLFVRPEEVTMPVVLRRQDQAPVVRLLVDLAPETSLPRALGAIDAALESSLPSSVRSRVGGASETFRRSLSAVGWSLLFSAFLVYLIIAAQFESLRQPLVVLAVVPVAVGGVALALMVSGNSWNLMSLMGCVVLVGIAVNDAIVKVDFIRRRRQEGLALTTALRQAGHDRFRPIVMTTLTTILGLMPLALGLGPGGSLRAPLAVAILGGISVSTVLSLFLVPVSFRALRC